MLPCALVMALVNLLSERMSTLRLNSLRGGLGVNAEFSSFAVLGLGMVIVL